MYRFILMLLVLGTVCPANGQNLSRLKTIAYDWEKLDVQKTKSGERRQIFEGYTEDLSYFEIHVTTLKPGLAPHGSHVHADMEEFIIVKEGQIEITLNDTKTLAGPGSVFLALPGDRHGIWNAGDTQASYYIIRWKKDTPVQIDRAKASGGSKLYDWEKVSFKTTKKGGRRQFMQRPTALLEELEMHVTTLKPGITSHGEHVHPAEEIILVKKGLVEESINGEKYQLGPGSLILLIDDVPHGIRNIGDEECEYFAFKWR